MPPRSNERTSTDREDLTTYFLVYRSFEPAIEGIGTLGQYEGLKYSDHVFLFMECRESVLFKGIINRPMHHPSREFKLDQADRVQKFLKRFRELAEDHSLEKRAKELVTLFELYGCNEMNKKRYQTLDTDIHDMLISAARSVIKGKC